MLKKEKIKEMIEKGKIDLYDIDKEADLLWAVADLYCVEKHLNMSLNHISAKLKENPSENLKKLYEALARLLNEVRKERAKHLKKIAKLKYYSVWCIYKHLLGAMMQFGEVASKCIFSNQFEEAKECYETSEFCFETILFLNALAKKFNKEVEKCEKT